MSKKSKSKLKKQHKAKIIQESITSSDITQPKIANETTNTPDIITPPNKLDTKSMSRPESSLLPEVDRVKKDVKRIGIVVGIIVLCIIIAKIADEKTGWVLKLSDNIIKSLSK